MRLRIPAAFSLLLAAAAFTAGCSSARSTPGNAVPAMRNYSGTASVGDFFTITVNSTAQTIFYTDVSNGDIGAVPYKVNSDGTYALNDPKGNLITAYEIPGYAMLLQAAKTGQTMDTPALVTAVESSQVSTATFEGHSYNYMQFRTSSGGVEIGSVTISSQGVGTNTSYWPYGALNSGNGGQSLFNEGSIDMTKAEVDSSGTFLRIPSPGNGIGFDYIFGAANGMFAVDTQNGAILGLPKAESGNFDSSFSGAYRAIFYQKTGVSTGDGNMESGTPSLGNATITVNSAGQVTITDAQGNIIVQGKLIPVANAGYLYGGSGELQDPGYGLFTFRITSATAQQDVFVSFMNQAMLFSSFSAGIPWTQGGKYSYFYGMGLK